MPKVACLGHRTRINKWLLAFQQSVTGYSSEYKIFFELGPISIKVGNRCFKNVAQFRYLGKIITNQSLIQEEIKRRLNSGNACYHSVQNLLYSRLLSKKIKIIIYKIIILPAVLYGYENWSRRLH
jgi:hypothetical protein